MAVALRATTRTLGALKVSKICSALNPLELLFRCSMNGQLAKRTSNSGVLRR